MILDDFNPSVTILPSDFISQTDDKLRTITDEQKVWLETQVQKVVDELVSQTQNVITEFTNNTNALVVPSGATYDLDSLETALNGLLTQVVAQQAQIKILMK